MKNSFTPRCRRLGASLLTLWFLLSPTGFVGAAIRPAAGLANGGSTTHVAYSLASYDNAARYAGANGLRLGVALTDEQIARLGEPLLWYETQSVTGPDGETYGALVPKVYLPEASRAALVQLNGGLIRAGRLEVWGDRVQPGGFVSAATLNLDAGRIESISGEFFENGQEATARLRALLGSDFRQAQNEDRTQSRFRAKASGGLKQVAIQVLRSGLSGAISGGVGGYYGSTYSVERLAVETAAGCVDAAVMGEECANGAKSAFATASLAWANRESRDAMIADSKKFPGICDAQGNCLDNKSGSSAGVNTDNFKLAGGRVDLELLCGENFCLRDANGNFLLDREGRVRFIGGEAKIDGMPVQISSLEQSFQPLWMR